MAENVEGGGNPLETSGYLSDMLQCFPCSTEPMPEEVSICILGKGRTGWTICLFCPRKHTTRLRCSFHVSASLQSDITVLVDLHLCPPPAGRTYRHPSVSFLLFPCLHLPASDLCCCLCIKGVEEVCHLRLLPADPFIYFKQRKAQRITVGGFQTSSFLRGSPSLLGPGLCF